MNIVASPVHLVVISYYPFVIIALPEALLKGRMAAFASDADVFVGGQ
ncbi:MAG: hypothetical protein ABIM74_05535 [candidate division WOR-3 bacterium]